MKRKVLVVHGPNLNMLGRREPDVYGEKTLSEINQVMTEYAHQLDISLTAFQSNYEGEIVEAIQAAEDDYQGVIINLAAYTHTSVAIRDAILTLDLPVIEVHLSNIYKRESFRHHSMVSDVVTGQIVGLGAKGYILALSALAEMIPDAEPS